MCRNFAKRHSFRALGYHPEERKDFSLLSHIPSLALSLSLSLSLTVSLGTVHGRLSGMSPWPFLAPAEW